MTETKYMFVIDTDSYAGNFERPLTAYCTGCTGDCGVGEGQAELFEQEEGEDVLYEADEFIGSEPDDRGCHRPCVIYPTPGWTNDGKGNYEKAKNVKYPAYLSVAIHMTEKPPEVWIERIKRRANIFAANPNLGYRDGWDLEKPFTITGYRWITETITTTAESELI